MRKYFFALVIALAVASLAAASAQAITFGNLDGNRHPNVGALIAEWDEPGQKDILCSGSLIAPRVFLTAAHCTAYLTSIGIGPDQVWVTFDPEFTQNSTLIHGTYHTNPAYPGPSSNPNDLAVVILDQAPNITPVRLPRAGLLDSLKAQGVLQNQKFTAVGYGTVENDKTAGSQTFSFDGVRRYVMQTFNALNKNWLRISQNPSTSNGGTCYGDSGGPHFLGSSDLQVAITVTGDAICRATDVDYRLDTPSARNFLKSYVTLP